MKLRIVSLAFVFILSGAVFSSSLMGFANFNSKASFDVKAASTYYTLTVIVDGGGWLDPGHGIHTYEAGTVVSVLWWHQPNWGLDRYELNGTVIELPPRPYNITMNANYVLRAVYFEYQPLDISISPITATIDANSSVTFVAQFTDGVPPFQVEWYLNDSLMQVLVDQEARIYEWAFSPAKAGTYQVYVMALDVWVVLPREQWPRSRIVTVTVNDVLCTLNITADTGGTTSPAPSEYGYSFGTEVNVSALPATGYFFDHWELGGVDVGASNPVSIVMNSTSSLHAVFAERLHYTFHIVSNEGGNVVPAQGEHVYWAGTTVSVSANPDVGYYLGCWELDGIKIGMQNPIDFTIDANHTLNVFFKQLSPGHDVAIRWAASKTAVGQGYSTTIEANAMDVGSFGEAFNVTAYVNESPIQTRLVSLESGVATTVSATWNTSGYARGDYTVKVVASPVDGEIDTLDNVLVLGSVHLGISGDVNADGKVDVKDVYKVALAYGSIQEGPNPLGRQWNPNCDINNDGKIDVKDVYIASKHFGETES